MASPRGEKSSGSWEFVSIDEPRGFEVIDSFVDDEGNPLDGFPAMRMTFRFDSTEAGSRMVNTSYFDSAEALEQVVAMGAVEGSRMAMAQLDAVLQDLREYAEGKGTRVELLDDTHVRITRLVNGPRELVWRAYDDPELIPTWMLGPDGWEMTECVVGTEVGDSYRSVTTERMQGMPVETINDMSLYEEDGMEQSYQRLEREVLGA